MLPAVVENCAECTYPLPEELSIGLLFFGLLSFSQLAPHLPPPSGGNIVGIPCIFIVQVLLSKRIGDAPPPFLPSNLFIESQSHCSSPSLSFTPFFSVIFIVTLFVLFFYNGH
jgi:hypothetical protein